MVHKFLSLSLLGLGYTVTVNQQVQHEYNNNIVLTEVNKTAMFIVPNIYYCGRTHTHSVFTLSFSVYVTLNDLCSPTYIFEKPVPIYDF